LAYQPEDDSPTKGVLSASDQHDIEVAFAGATNGQPAGRAPEPSPVVRWSDVPLALAYACDDAEMAIVEADESDEVCRYRLVSVEDWPGTMIVTRTDDSRVYKATATVGVFGDHADRAARLVDALEKQLTAFAKKRRFE